MIKSILRNKKKPKIIKIVIEEEDFFEYY